MFINSSIKKSKELFFWQHKSWVLLEIKRILAIIYRIIWKVLPKEHRLVRCYATL